MLCLTVHVYMNSVKFVLEAPGASILWGRYYSVTMYRLTWGALLLGRALLIGTLRYIYIYARLCAGHTGRRCLSVILSMAAFPTKTHGSLHTNGRPPC